MQIELTTQAASQESAALSAAIVGFNHANVPGLEPIEAEVRFFVFARDDDGAVVGGIRAACYWNTLHIELLWLSQDLRGQGAGRALMARAEAFAREHACQLALVETTSWQARPFYEKCGYTCIATIPDRPRGHTSYTLHKRLDASAAESPGAAQGAPGAGRFLEGSSASCRHGAGGRDASGERPVRS